jgi:hypothetical protein
MNDPLIYVKIPEPTCALLAFDDARAVADRGLVEGTLQGRWGLICGGSRDVWDRLLVELDAYASGRLGDGLEGSPKRAAKAGAAKIRAALLKAAAAPGIRAALKDRLVGVPMLPLICGNCGDPSCRGHDCRGTPRAG